MKTVTICGSMKFAEEMKSIAWDLETRAALNVLQCVYNEKNEPITEESLKNLTAAHLKKIDMCDTVYIADINGYIGEAVKREISYAREKGKEIIFHSSRGFVKS